MFDDPTERKLALAEAVRNAPRTSFLSHLRAWLFTPGDHRLTLGHATEAAQRDMRR